MSTSYPQSAAAFTSPPISGSYVNGVPQNPFQQQQQQQQQQQIQQNSLNQSPQKLQQQLFNANKFVSAPLPPPSITQQNQFGSTGMLAQQNHLPPQVRQNISLTNGTGTANSSRTSSPGLNNSMNNQHNNYPPQNVQPSTTKPLISPTNANDLSGGIKNLSLGANISTNNFQNQLPPPPPASSNIFPMQYNFKTSALNTMPSNTVSSPPGQHLNQNVYTQPQQMPKIQPTGLLNNASSVNVPPPPSSSNGSMPPISHLHPPLTNSNNLPNPGLQQQQQQQKQHNFNLNAFNNNAIPPPPQNSSYPGVFAHQQPPPPPTTVKKSMYPGQQLQQQQSHLPVMTNQMQQQQQKLQHQQQSFINGQRQPSYQQQPSNFQQNQQPNILQQGFNKFWGQDTFDLIQNRHILSPKTIQTPSIVLHDQFQESVNVNPDIMRCTLNKIPESNALLQKTRLPLGILIHPFRDINSLPVIQCPNIVRCRLCRNYINPFVYFVDSKMWKCNLCYRVNELPEDFQYDPATKTYGDVTRRPEVRSSTIEFIAPTEYMLRPPQPATYLFLFDVSILAQQSGYLETACQIVSKHLDDMPGDARAQVGFIAYNSAIHFYNISEGYNQPREMTLLDIDDPFLPCPDNLLVNLKECKELIKDLLNQLPNRFAESHDPGSCLGSALQVAFKLMMQSGGRVTVFQTCLPNKGAGALQPREDPNNRSSKDVAHLNPATDFYKRHALECSGYQIAVDLFVMNQQYVDLATISGISKHCGGCVHHFPLYQKTKPHHVDAFKQCLKRYLMRKIGFEAVMRIRCTRGLQVHTFHGNFFVRSVDLLSLPNVNPDAGYGMQISYEESLTDIKQICLQAALLYTNSEGERRIRVHTLCLPVTANLNEALYSADSQAIVGLLSKMAVDRSLASNLSDAREAFVNATIDILSAYKLSQNFPPGTTGQLMAPKNLALLPLYISALLKHTAFRIGTSTRLDDRIAAMDAMKTLPLDQLMKYIYPEFYQIDCLFNLENSNDDDDDELPGPMYLQLSAEFLDSRSMFLIDSGTLIIIYVGINVPTKILENVLGVKSTAEIPDVCYGLPTINTEENDALKCFINHLNEDKPYLPIIQIIRDTSTSKSTFIEKLVDDRTESSLSYYEFLQHLRTQVK